MGSLESWRYLPVFNACVVVLLTIALGVLAGASSMFNIRFVDHAVKFVFYICLPALVVRGLGILIDFYDFTPSDWRYIFVFLVLRAVALFLVAVVAFAAGPLHDGIGSTAVMWLCTTWISTVILGIPILSAVFGSSVLGSFYGLLAAISSFIFQLPLQLFFLECHVLEREYFRTKRATAAGRLGGVEESVANVDADSRWSLWGRFASEPSLWYRVCAHIFTNPVIIALGIGFILTLSTAGRYLDPSDADFIISLAWIEQTLAWFGACVSPVSLFFF